MVRKPKAGRPPRHAGEHLVKNRTFRVWRKLDHQLQAAAGQSRRTVSAEIEFRLELSFLVDRLDAKMRALLGVDLKGALIAQLGGLGTLGDEEEIRRWAKKIAKGVADIEAEERQLEFVERVADIEAKEQRRLERKKT